MPDLLLGKLLMPILLMMLELLMMPDSPLLTSQLVMPGTPEPTSTLPTGVVLLLLMVLGIEKINSDVN